MQLFNLSKLTLVVFTISMVFAVFAVQAQTNKTSGVYKNQTVDEFSRSGSVKRAASNNSKKKVNPDYQAGVVNESSELLGTQTTYSLFCRGPLSYVTGTGNGFTTVFFTKNTRSSGDKGIYLSPGTCAWADRVVSSTEPSKLTFVEYKAPTIDKLTLAATVPVFTSCNPDSKCVFMIRVYNDKGTQFSSPDTVMYVYYPFPL